MPSLTQLLASHSHLLILDAASLKVQIGLLGNSSRDGIWRSTEGEAGKEIFAGIEIVLHEAGVGLGDVDAFVFCEGPGSGLGIRTVAMALRTWHVLKPRPIYAYQSLVVAGHFEWLQMHRSFFVITDARRDTWHCQPVDPDGRMPPLQRIPAAKFPDGELVTPENFRAWAKPPRPAGRCSYDLAKIFPALATDDYFRMIEAPDAFQHEAPEYKKWSAQIHRATTVPRR